MMLRVLSTVLFLFMISKFSYGNNYDGMCIIEVKKILYLNKICKIKMMAGGGFAVGTGENSSEDHFAYVNIDDGIAYGFWNGKEGESHAHEPLGRLYRKGACWQNNNAKICAYK